jgi:hypothetical protein
MREEYLGLLQEAWDAALRRRLEMSPRSPVRVLDRCCSGVPGRFAQELHKNGPGLQRGHKESRSLCSGDLLFLWWS